MSTDSALNDRYGRKANVNHARRFRLLITSLVVTVIVAWLAWILVTDQLGFGPKVSWTDTGHSIISSSEVRVDYAVEATTGREVACAIQAQDKTFTIVGWRVVVLPASSERIRTFSDTVSTMGQATTGLVAQCWLT